MSEERSNQPAPTPGTTGQSAEGAGAEPAAPQETAGGTPQEEIRQLVIKKLHSCYDPEIPVDIYELGLIYDVSVTPENAVHIRMTLTSPMCPAAGSLPGEVEMKTKDVPGVSDAKVDIVWEPVWKPEMMSEAARLKLGMM